MAKNNDSQINLNTENSVYKSPMRRRATKHNNIKSKLKIIVLLMCISILGYTSSYSQFSGGTGIATSPFLLSSLQDLYTLETNVNNGTSYQGAYFKVTNDIGVFTGIIGNYNNPFRGELDGAGYKITVDINVTTNIPNVGLFGCVDDNGGGSARIYDLIVDGSVNGGNYAQNTGGFVGQVTGNCYFNNCLNLATVTGSFNTGGIVGLINAAGQYLTFMLCTNNGNIIGNTTAFVAGFSNIGGIVGYANSNTQNVDFGCCKNAGTIESISNQIYTTAEYDPEVPPGEPAEPVPVGLKCMAGIVASVECNTVIKECVNIGKIFSNNYQYAGGITANVLSLPVPVPLFLIDRCNNAGFVDGAKNNVGGIIGHAGSNVDIFDCINTNLINQGTALIFYGAIAGNNNGRIRDCYYDLQMSVIGGVENMSIPGVAEEKMTNDMTGQKLMLIMGNLGHLKFFKEELYPIPYTDSEHPISLLAASPIYLDNDTVNNVTQSPFIVSNDSVYPYRWGSFSNNPWNYNLHSVNNHISITAPVPPSTTANIISTGQDSLVVQLDTQFRNNGYYPGYNDIYFEKYVPINVIQTNVCYDTVTINHNDGGTIIDANGNLFNDTTIILPCGESIELYLQTDSCYIVDSILVVDAPVNPNINPFIYIGTEGTHNINVLFKDTCTDCSDYKIEIRREDNSNFGKTNDTSVRFRIYIDPPFSSPYLDANDFEVSTGSNISLISPPNYMDSMEIGIYYIDVDVSNLGNNCPYSDTVKVVIVNGCEVENMQIIADEFYDVKREFCFDYTTTLPCGSTNADTFMTNATITFDNPVSYNNPYIDVPIILKSNNSSIIVTGHLSSSYSNTITFSYSGLEVGTEYQVCILPGSLKDDWNNVNDTICLCSFTTRPENCITSIERYNPVTEKTNENILEFLVTFAEDISALNPNDISVSFSDNVETEPVGNIPTNTWIVRVNANINNTNKEGEIVQINNIDGYIFCNNDSNNESYNVRNEFMAEVKVWMKNQAGNLQLAYVGSVAQGSNNLNIKRNDGLIRISFDENNIEVEPNAYLSPNVLSIGVNGTFSEMSYDNDTSYCDLVINNTVPNTQFYMDFIFGHRKVLDEWNNELNLNDFGWIFETGLYKIASGENYLTSSFNEKFVVGDIHPNPVTDNRAEFTIKFFEEGYLNVAVYDLSGAFVTEVVSNKFMNADTEFKVPMHLGMLQTGTYTLVISNGFDNVMKQIIIVK